MAITFTIGPESEDCWLGKKHYWLDHRSDLVLQDQSQPICAGLEHILDPQKACGSLKSVYFLQRPTFHEFSYAMAPLVSWAIFWSCTTSWFIQVAPLDQCQVSLDTAKLYPKRAQGSTADHVWDTQWADAGSSACLKGHFFSKPAKCWMQMESSDNFWFWLNLVHVLKRKECSRAVLNIPWGLGCCVNDRIDLQRTAG